MREKMPYLADLRGWQAVLNGERKTIAHRRFNPSNPRASVAKMVFCFDVCPPYTAFYR
jgi:hypothetical protein